MPARVPIIEASDLLARLRSSAVDAPGDEVTEADCAHAIEIAVSLVRAHTRGRGLRTSVPEGADQYLAQGLAPFVIDAAPEVAAVIALVAARLAGNAAQETYRSVSEDGFGGSTRGAFQGLTLAEQVALAPWRRRLGVA